MCDSDARKSAEFGLQFRVESYTSVAEMLTLAHPQIVCVCSPSGCHAQHAIAALKQGCHVLCEKPMAIHAADAVEMVNEAHQSGKRLFIVKQNRYNLPVAAVKELLVNNRLGKIHYFQINCFWNRNSSYYDNSWRGTSTLDGGTLYTQFSHFIDLLYWYLGNVQAVSGWRANYAHKGIVDFEDTGSAALTMESGAIGTLNWTINAYPSNIEGSFSLFGERGSVKIGGSYLDKIEYFFVENENSNDWLNKTSADKQNRHEEVYRAMIGALENPSLYVVEAEEGLKSVQIIEQIYAACPLLES